MIVAVGTSYKYAPLAQIERIAFTRSSLADALDYFANRKRLKGCIILSTCNRVEFYVSMNSLEEAVAEIQQFLKTYFHFEYDNRTPYFYAYSEVQAVSHLYAVASGLDSAIIGETQVLGQVKNAFFEAEQRGMVDTDLRCAFHQAFSMAKKIHSSTQISAGKVSIGSVAIEYIKDKIGTLSDKSVLLIGVGKVTELVVKYLQKESPDVVFIANRTFERAQAFACQIGGKALHFDMLDDALIKADIIISATASPHLILRADRVARVLHTLLPHQRHHRYFIDLAMPRDIDPAIASFDGVSLYGLEQVGSLMQRNLERKKRRAHTARHIIESQVKRLWNESMCSEPVQAASH